MAGVPTTLSIDAGAAVRVVGTGLQLTVLGQTLTGDLTITRSTDAAGRAILTVDGRNLALVLGSGTTTATITQHGSATLVVAPTGVKASIGVDVAVSVPGVTVSGNVALVIDSATGYLKATGTGLDLNVLGQRIHGSFTFEQVGTGPTAVVRIGVADGTISLGGLVEVSDAHGLFVLAGGGVAGELPPGSPSARRAPWTSTAASPWR